jgi:hypothetical protein
VTPHLDIARQAKAARADVEAILDLDGWGWNLGLWRWLDVLVLLEEGDR